MMGLLAPSIQHMSVTDGQTERHRLTTALCVASRGK